jgi:cytochrome c556
MKRDWRGCNVQSRGSLCRSRAKTGEIGTMMRTVAVVGTLLLGAGAVLAQQDIAVQQDNLMRGQGKSLYGTILKTVKGEIPYDQSAIDTAIAQLEESVGKIAVTFRPNPKQHVVDAKYGASQKVWKNKADFDSKIPPVARAIADVKGKIKDIASLTAAYTSINDRCTDCHETYRLKLK